MQASELGSRLASSDRHQANDLIDLFNALFVPEQKTKLIGGGDEPLYLPATHDFPYARVVFTADYFSSALHEIAHWCLAGPQRRAQVDYGYWYVSDRSPEQQREFERAEVKPQALEQLFSQACGYPFRPSFDNLRVPEYSSQWFDERRDIQVQHFLDSGLPARAQQFYSALHDYYFIADGQSMVSVYG
ncbi:MAG: elongation factor P hydroxylase [Pseudomonadales bacterium]